MKNKDLLNILGDIDEDMIEDAAPSFSSSGRVIKRKKRTSMKIVAIAACCALIVCGAVMLLSVLDKIDDPTPHPDGDTGNSEGNETEEGTSEKGTNDGFLSDESEIPTEQDGENDDVQQPDGGNNADNDSDSPSVDNSMEMTHSPSGEETEVATEEFDPNGPALDGPYYYPVVTIVEDGQFEKYVFTDQYCPQDMVGEKIAEKNAKLSWEGIYPAESFDIKIEINRVIGVNGEICMCYRFIGSESDYPFYIDYTSYHYMTADSYAFISLFDMKEKLFSTNDYSLSNTASYWMDTEEDYCNLFYVADISRSLKNLLFATNGTPVKIENGAFNIGTVTEEVTFSYHTKPFAGRIRVFDSGYIYFDDAMLGQHIFNIGTAAARNIIDLVIHSGEPNGYVWSENEGKWYPIKDDELAQYQSFHEALDEGKLLNQLELWKDVEYWETKFHGWSPDVVIINEKTQACVLEVLYECDGGAVEVEDIKKLAGEGFLFEAIYLDGSKYQIAVYDSGHVNLGGHFYYVGTDYTDKIIGVVRVKCTTYPENASYFLWNEKESCWSTYSAEMIETEKATSPNESVDRTSEVDVLETETHIEESVDLTRDDTEVETETCVEIETELESEIAP